ncbi:MAG: hypothetical protein AAGE93_15690 [Bacteroidota bacterium]
MRKIVPFLFLVLIQCTQAEEPATLLDEYYSAQEINDLRKLLAFVEEQITKDCELSSQECIDLYFSSFKNTKAGSVELNIDRRQQRELLEGIDKNLFNDIWGFCTDRQGTKYLCTNNRGKFARMLKRISEENSRLKSYSEAFFAASDFSPSMTGTLLKYPESFNFEYEPEFILAAVHLLTINLDEEPYYEM